MGVCKSDGVGYTSWSRQAWIDWLIRREALHRQVNRYSGRIPLPDKGLNSVIITSPSALLNAFEGNRQPVFKNDICNFASIIWLLSFGWLHS